MLTIWKHTKCSPWTYRAPLQPFGSSGHIQQFLFPCRSSWQWSQISPAQPFLLLMQAWEQLPNNNKQSSFFFPLTDMGERTGDSSWKNARKIRASSLGWFVYTRASGEGGKESSSCSKMAICLLVCTGLKLPQSLYPKASFNWMWYGFESTHWY